MDEEAKLVSSATDVCLPLHTSQVIDGLHRSHAHTCHTLNPNFALLPHPHKRQTVVAMTGLLCFVHSPSPLSPPLSNTPNTPQQSRQPGGISGSREPDGRVERAWGGRHAPEGAMAPGCACNGSASAPCTAPQQHLGASRGSRARARTITAGRARTPTAAGACVADAGGVLGGAQHACRGPAHARHNNPASWCPRAVAHTLAAPPHERAVAAAPPPRPTSHAQQPEAPPSRQHAAGVEQPGSRSTA
jgi:hypothetical protein